MTDNVTPAPAPSPTITFEIPLSVLRDQMAAALVRGSDTFGRGEVPLATMCARVVKAQLPDIERSVSEAVRLVLVDDVFARELQATLRTALTAAIEAKAKSIVASLNQSSILALVGKDTAAT